MVADKERNGNGQWTEDVNGKGRRGDGCPGRTCVRGRRRAFHRSGHFTGAVTSQDGNYVAHITQSIVLNASVTDISFTDIAPGEYWGEPSREYRWYVNGDLQTGATGSSIALSNGQAGINGPALYNVTCEIRIGLQGNDGGWLSDWILVGARQVTFFELDFVTIRGNVVNSLTVLAGTEEEVSTVYTPSCNPSVTFTPTTSDISLRHDATAHKLYITVNTAGRTGDVNAIYRNSTIKSLHVVSADEKVEVYIVP